MICGSRFLPPEATVALEAAGIDDCCYGSAFDGPAGCTCWDEVYDLTNDPPRTDLPVRIAVRPCPDCAYSVGSPERAGATHVAGDQDALDKLVATGEPFFCHQGMRCTVGYEHPAGLRVDVDDRAGYRPEIIDGVPYQADGTPGLLCAGWARRAPVDRVAVVRPDLVARLAAVDPVDLLTEAVDGSGARAVGVDL